MAKPGSPILDGRSGNEDYSAFNEVWDRPDGGLHRYLYRFLTSADTTFQHIAVWTIVQLLESGGKLVYFYAIVTSSSPPQKNFRPTTDQ